MFFEGRDDAHKLPKTARNMLGPSTDGQETLKLILRLHKEQYPIAVFKSAKLSQKNIHIILTLFLQKFANNTEFSFFSVLLRSSFGKTACFQRFIL